MNIRDRYKEPHWNNKSETILFITAQWVYVLFDSYTTRYRISDYKHWISDGVIVLL